jgi:hypothetical protein
MDKRKSSSDDKMPLWGSDENPKIGTIYKFPGPITVLSKPEKTKKGERIRSNQRTFLRARLKNITPEAYEFVGKKIDKGTKKTKQGRGYRFSLPKKK